METEVRAQIISNYKQRSLERIKYAEFDLKNGDYEAAFRRSLGVIEDMGRALLISKDQYIPSARYVFKILHLHEIQAKRDKYLANPDQEEIKEEEAEAALKEAKRLFAQAKDI